MAEVTELFYDTEGDVLYLSVGKPRRAVSQEMGDDVLLRVDPDTGEIVGLTILNFSARFSSLKEPQTLPVQVTLQRE
ncbi:MAG TPA: DUF2283 domain-containing protein [Chloroflexi bacterium]|nr:DUF2283 domain-containing protein [Chloroflexota bacterium]